MQILSKIIFLLHYIRKAFVGSLDASHLKKSCTYIFECANFWLFSRETGSHRSWQFRSLHCVTSCLRLCNLFMGLLEGLCWFTWLLHWLQLFVFFTTLDHCLLGMLFVQVMFIIALSIQIIEVVRFIQPWLKNQWILQIKIMKNQQIPTKQSIQEAHQRIKKHIHQTPLLSSTAINAIAGTKSFYLKCQNLQKIGAFKARGACNALLKMDQKIKNVCTHSSGNHAMALAYMAQKMGKTAYIVMPQNSPALKKKSVVTYGANVIVSGNKVQQRQKACNEISEKYNASIVHSYNDYNIIQGQATVAKEIFNQKPNFFDYVLFPIGGGGLGSGTLLSTKFFGNECKAVGVEPQLAKDAYLSMLNQERHPQFPPITIGDGLRVNLGQKNFQIMKEHLKAEDIILVSEQEIISAMQLVFERMKIVIEPSSATVIAGLLKDPRFKGKNVCCIISGGNVDMQKYFDFLRAKL